MKIKVGNKAPEITGKDQNGKPVSLKDYAGKKLILYFYPKDLTPGCTVESCDFRDHYQDLTDQGFDVLGVSADDEAKHQKFIDKHELPFRLLADVDKKVINAYGVWGPKKFMGKEYDGINRTTFVINEQGNIQLIIEKVKTKESTQQILAELNK